MPIVEGDETYLNAAEVADLLGVSRPWFYQQDKFGLQQYEVGVSKRKMYRQSDAQALKAIKPVEPEQK